MDFSDKRLQEAINKDEFILVYHPIISINDVKVSGAEALLRWKHPEQGLLGPSDFLQNLTNRDISAPIAKWVFEECFKQWQNWTEKNSLGKHMFLSMNCTERDLRSESFLQLISDKWANSNSVPHKFYLEVSEQTAINIQSSNTPARKFLENHPSVELCVDEFGIEDPSMNKLDNWPTDILKFDRSMITRLDNDPSYELFIKNLLDYAQKKKLTVIVEGIETEEQFKQFFDWDCEYGQGYYFSKPIEHNPSKDLNLKNLRRLVNEIGTRKTELRDDDLLKNYEIYDNPRVVFGTQAGPITDLLERMVDTYELPNNIFHDQQQLSSILEDFEVDILVLDEKILNEDNLSDYYQKIKQLKPNLRWLIITEDQEYKPHQTLTEDDKVDLLRKPINKLNFLELLSKQSYLLSQSKTKKTFLNGIFKNNTFQKTTTYVLLITASVFIGLYLGMTMESVKNRIGPYFSNRTTIIDHIGEIKEYIRKMEKHERKER